MKAITSQQLRLLTSHTPRTNFDAFPFGLYEYTPGAEAAMFYGFTPVRPLKSSDIENKVKEVMADLPFYFSSDKNEKTIFNLREKAELIKMYRENRIPALPSPTMLYFEKPLSKVGQANQDTYKHYCSLECLGVKHSIAEALIIQTAYAILEEEGFDNLTVEINSLGSAESRARFENALNIFVRSNLNEMPEVMRQQCQQSPYALFSFSNAVAEQLQKEAPQPIAFLSESCRRHLGEVLEYLEALDIPYEINNSLMARGDIQSHIIFNIVTKSDSPKQNIISCLGMRYTPIAQRLGFRREIPAVGAYISYTTPIKKRVNRKKKINPRFCFVHLGFEAKIKSLQVINMLRKKRIPLCHSLTKDRLAPQMSTADRLRLPYLIIMGQKEALEGTVMIRDIEDRSQETISITDLPDYMRKKR